MRVGQTPLLLVWAVVAGVLGGGAGSAVAGSLVPAAGAARAVAAPAGIGPAAGAAAAAPVAAAVPVAAAAPVAAQVAAAAPVAAAAAAPVRAAAPASAASARPASSATVAGTPCAATARACIDLTHNKAWLIANGTVVYGPVPITSGRKGWRTPAGTFRVQFKDIDHRSTIFNDAPMPYSVFFNGGIAFHQGSLAVPSHGCIHLSRAAAMRFFADLRVGDVVQAVR